MRKRLALTLGRASLISSLCMLAPACGNGISGDPEGSPSTNPGTGVGGGSGATPSYDAGAPVATCQCLSQTSPPGAMVPVFEGGFHMGCNAPVDAECAPDEFPARIVTLRAFEIGFTEVTQAEYAACVVAAACQAPKCTWDCARTNYAATCLTREDARAYCAWAGMRLPTEAEWEKAARGTDGRKFPWGNQPATCELANMLGCTGDARPVGSHPAGASPYGAVDMAGNMVEMTADWYDPVYYATSPVDNPPGPPSGISYVGRGGGWKSPAIWNRASVRDWYSPTDQGMSLGFRCAK
jgi:formylglycine-generating enzyme required for sulfatase activity